MRQRMNLVMDHNDIRPVDGSKFVGDGAEDFLCGVRILEDTDRKGMLRAMSVGFEPGQKRWKVTHILGLLPQHLNLLVVLGRNKLLDFLDAVITRNTQSRWPGLVLLRRLGMMIDGLNLGGILGGS